MPPASRPAPPRRRAVAAAVVLPLLLALTSCLGYGSQAVRDAPKVAPQGPKLSADAVRVGYFANLTHGTALVGDREGFFQKELRGTRLTTAVFGAGRPRSRRSAAARWTSPSSARRPPSTATSGRAAPTCGSWAARPPAG